uniref:Uncharacterized protein n=1 Tax=Glossina palpalis gambiensis TaxID=67801 RepID=A0A1B0BS82_9MUSC
MTALCLSLNLLIVHNSRPTHYVLNNDCTFVFDYSSVSDFRRILWGFVITYLCVANNAAGSEVDEANNGWECIANKRKRLKHLKRLHLGWCKLDNKKRMPTSYNQSKLIMINSALLINV